MPENGYTDITDFGLGSQTSLDVSLNDRSTYFNSYVYARGSLDESINSNLSGNAGITIGKYGSHDGTDYYQTTLGLKGGVSYQHDIGTGAYYKLHGSLETSLTQEYNRPQKFDFEVGPYVGLKTEHDKNTGTDVTYATLKYGVYPKRSDDAKVKENACTFGNVFGEVGGEIGLTRGESSVGVYASAEKCIFGHDTNSKLDWKAGVVYSKDGIFGNDDMGFSIRGGVTTGRATFDSKGVRPEVMATVIIGL